MAFVREICRSECEWPLYDRSVGVNVNGLCTRDL